MATKAELESQIETLKAELREREKAIRILSKKSGMEITLPYCSQDMMPGDAPYISGQCLTEKLLAILEPALRKHGAKLKMYTAPAKSLCLHNNSFRTHGDTIVVPVIWGEVMAEIIDCAAAFGRRCYADGYANGSEMLTRLARGEVTVDDFEDATAREKAVRRQKHKDVKGAICVNQS